MRERTEWIKTVKDGWNILIGADKEKIVKMANEFKPNKRQRNVFGDGEASKKIVEIIMDLKER